MPKAIKDAAIVISALHARANFSRLLRRIEKEGRSVVIERRGSSSAILLSIQDYVHLAAHEPGILKAMGEDSKRNGKDKFTSFRIGQLIKSTRSKKLRS